MGKRIKKLKKIRIHREGTNTLLYGGILLVALALIFWYSFDSKIPFAIFIAIFGTVYAIVTNFYRCPIRYFGTDDTERIVVAPADGKIVVVEEVDENRYFHDRRIMVSIFMSLWNVHANWFPVDGRVKFVKHFNGNFHKAWLPKASEENEHADVMITTPDGADILCRQIAGAVARRIVTYAKEDVQLVLQLSLGNCAPPNSVILSNVKVEKAGAIDLVSDTIYTFCEICVKMGQATTGDQTVIAKLK